MKVLRIFATKEYDYEPIITPVNQIKYVRRNEEDIYPINGTDAYNRVCVNLVDGELVLGLFPSDESIIEVLGGNEK